MSDELVSAEEARRLREEWRVTDRQHDTGMVWKKTAERLAFTVEVQAWRIAELEAALEVAERALRDQPMQAFKSDAARRRRAVAISTSRSALRNPDA